MRNIGGGLVRKSLMTGRDDCGGRYESQSMSPDEGSQRTRDGNAQKKSAASARKRLGDGIRVRKESPGRKQRNVEVLKVGCSSSCRLAGYKWSGIVSPSVWKLLRRGNETYFVTYADVTGEGLYDG
jgi:hypothetical protein